MAKENAMCMKCDDLLPIDIRQPEDLRRAIANVNSSLIAGHIEDVTSTFVDVTFTELAKGGQWGDDVLFQFRCTQCGQMFELAAETYHGRGGWLKPVKIKTD